MMRLFPTRIKEDISTTTTSGSYGMPFTFYLTPEKRARQQAEVIYFSRWAGYKLGMGFAHVRAQQRGRLTLMMQNGYIMNPCVIDEDWLQVNRELLISKKIKFIVGYPSAIVPLAEYCRNKGDKPKDFGLIGMVTSAEPLSETVRQNFKNVFGCNILDRVFIQ